MNRNALALLFASLALSAKSEVQLLPAGEFKGRDGRPAKELTWKLSDAAGRALAAKLNARHSSIKFNFDYEHQLMLAKDNGQPAPASGWATKFEWRDGQGLYAIDVKWTDRARAHIEAGEYLYLSPVISYNRKTGEIDDVINAALVNTPNLDISPVAQERLAALSALATLSDTSPNLKEFSPMKSSLIALLGMAATATDDEVLTAVKALQAKANAAHASLAALHGALGLKADVTHDEASAAIAALKAQSLTGDPTTQKMIASLQAQVAALQNAANAKEVDALVTAALKDGKLLPAQKDWAINLGKSDLAQLAAFLKDAPSVGKALSDGQSAGAGKQQDGQQIAALSAEQKAFADELGLTEDEFRAGLAVA